MCGIIPILFDWKSQETWALLVTRHSATVEKNISSREEVCQQFEIGWTYIIFITSVTTKILWFARFTDLPMIVKLKVFEKMEWFHSSAIFGAYTTYLHKLYIMIDHRNIILNDGVSIWYHKHITLHWKLLDDSGIGLLACHCHVQNIAWNTL